MIVGYQNLLILVSLKLVYHPSLLKLTGFFFFKNKKRNKISENNIQIYSCLLYPVGKMCANLDFESNAFNKTTKTIRNKQEPLGLQVRFRWVETHIYRHTHT